MELTEFETLRNFTSEYLEFPPFVTAFNEIDRMVRLYRETGVASHLVVTGESGSGKTTLCKALETKYPRTSIPERDIVPVLIVAIPPAATIGSVAEVMLTQLGDPSPSFGTTSTKTARAVHLARECRVELLMFDEANHIQDRGQSPTQYMVGDWLKSVMDHMQVPTTLLGLPRVEDLLRVNEQLRRRFTRHVQMALGQDPEDNIESQCLQLFTSLTPSLPVPFLKGEMSWKELGHRLHAATDGRVAFVKSLLLGVIRLVFEQQLTRITPTELALAFTTQIWREGVNELNPFSSTFEFRRLDRAGEPFERGALIGRSNKRRQNAA
ncbi:AAA family ATPase [Duganella sp. FT50W]|uniref:AAA family ATPase n=1 Tax=Duganella lactea TaxID=2692173 RepID=A0A6L8MPM4_9BURK|nr:TniB family NTP-binding protein [Duganella lactea]MYM84126.1 AAA family ATPase [Duganella lactea]